MLALNAIFLAIVFVLCGCGADSSSPKTEPKKQISSKQAAPAPQGQESKAHKRGRNLLLSDAPTGLTPEELNARAKKEAAERVIRDPNFEVLPGLTLKEMEAKEAEALRKIKDPNMEVRPGLNVEQLRVKEAEALRKINDPTLEVFPGVTVQQLRAKEAEALGKINDPTLEVAPGMTMQQLRAKQQAAEAAAPK